MPPFEQLLGPFALTVASVTALAWLGKVAYSFVMGIWTEHLRVDHERAEALVKANARVDALRESNDANVKILDRAVAQNERLVAAVLAQGRTDAGN